MGEATGPGGRGVVGTTSASTGGGVYGHATSSLSTSTLYASGVYGTADSTWSKAVRGVNTASDFGMAIYGESLGKDGIGVYGSAEGTVSSSGVHGIGFYGVSGQSRSSVGYGIYADGHFGGKGNKYFIQPHPTDPSKAIQFVCLEGNESGTYFRGRTRLENNRAEIPIPEEWRLVSGTEGITVQVTPIRSKARQ